MGACVLPDMYALRPVALRFLACVSDKGTHVHAITII